VTLDTLIPIGEAARKFGLAEASLRALVDKGKIKAGILPNGEIVEENLDREILFNHARGYDLCATNCPSSVSPTTAVPQRQ
jgi:hypothetical protein